MQFRLCQAYMQESRLLWFVRSACSFLNPSWRGSSCSLCTDSLSAGSHSCRTFACTDSPIRRVTYPKGRNGQRERKKQCRDVSSQPEVDFPDVSESTFSHVCCGGGYARPNAFCCLGGWGLFKHQYQAHVLHNRFCAFVIRLGSNLAPGAAQWTP